MSIHSVIAAPDTAGAESAAMRDSSDLSRNKALVHEYVDAFNCGDLDRLCRLFAPGALIYGVLGWGAIDQVRPIWEQLVRCLRMQLSIEAIAEEGDTVAVRYTERGTFAEPWRGAPPTGRSYEVVAMEWFIVQEGRIVRRWGARDSAAISRQIGAPLR